MNDSTLEKILALAAGKTAAAEVYYQQSRNTSVQFENNRLKSLQTKATEGVALRVIRDGRLGFASSTDLSRLDELVDAAVETAAVGTAVDEGFATVELMVPAPDSALPTVPELVAVGEGLIEQAQRYNPDILVNIGFQVRSSRVELATSGGAYAERSHQLVSASLRGNLVQGEDFLEIDSSDVQCNRLPDCDRLMQRLLQKYRHAEQRATISSGSYPVLFTPRAVASTLGRMFSTILSGQAVVQKASPLAQQIGEKLFDSRLTVFEEPTIGPFACAFDDEATLTSPKVFVEQGFVQQFYWDRRWAAHSRNSPTGNGFRQGLSRPAPALVNLGIAPGNSSVGNLISGISKGLIVDQVLGAGQSNQLAGEFSVNLDLGYKVEQGKITGRVKNTMVASSIFEAFERLVDLGNDCEWVRNTYAPSLLFEQLGVASKN